MAGGSYLVMQILCMPIVSKRHIAKKAKQLLYNCVGKYSNPHHQIVTRFTKQLNQVLVRPCDDLMIRISLTLRHNYLRVAYSLTRRSLWWGSRVCLVKFRLDKDSFL